MERLLNYKKTGQFGGDLDTYYRYDSKKAMNDIYQKQLDKTSHQIQNLNKLSALIFPHQPYNFDQLQREIARLKYQELAPQVREEKAKYEQLITTAKEKVGAGSFVPIIDLFLEAHQQREKTVETSQKDKLSGKIEAYQGILENNLGKEELQTLSNKQKELCQLEEHLARLQINEQKIQIPPK